MTLKMAGDGTNRVIPKLCNRVFCCILILSLVIFLKRKNHCARLSPNNIQAITSFSWHKIYLKLWPFMLHMIFLSLHKTSLNTYIFASDYGQFFFYTWNKRKLTSSIAVSTELFLLKLGG